MKKKLAEIEARKSMTFGRLLGGAGGSELACLTMQILQNGASIHSRPAPPSGVWRNYGWVAPFATGPCPLPWTIDHGIAAKVVILNIFAKVVISY